MKEQTKIPTGKVERALSFVGAGAKVGGNYIKYWVKKQMGDEDARENLDKSNADDIYQTLSTLKGSALKVAQMLSMDKNMLPTAYQEKFQMAQYSAPPLSYPLVKRTFKQEIGSDPLQCFESFSQQAIHAASIGQVHKAEKDGLTYAVKVQYPGVADSVNADLKMVKPIATRLFNLQGTDIDKYFEEVRSKLLEETDYRLELARGKLISNACKHIDSLSFPSFYEEFSSERVLTMNWMEGKPLSLFLESNPSQTLRNKIGQTLWDFYHYQIYHLRMVHADPHPGNFLVSPDKKLVVLDFGCVKEIPEFFFMHYFELLKPETLSNEIRFEEILYALDFLLKEDDPQKIPFYKNVFRQMISLLGRPFANSTFDFAQKSYFEEIYALGEKFSKMKELKEANGARGAQDGLYINRTYFGLYNLLHLLRAEIDTRIIDKKG